MKGLTISKSTNYKIFDVLLLICLPLAHTAVPNFVLIIIINPLTPQFAKRTPAASNSLTQPHENGMNHNFSLSVG